jgi:hypothetical protein
VDQREPNRPSDEEQSSLIDRAIQSDRGVQRPEEELPESEEPQVPPGTLMSPVPGYNTSPVRPEDPNPPRKKVMPSIPQPSRPDVPYDRELTPTEQIDTKDRDSAERAAAALERIRKKMTTIAEEYAQGKINKAQFNAIYRRYQEQRDITERLIKRDPESGAWQVVVQPGHTSFLRSHFEARVKSFAIYYLNNGRQIVLNGQVQLPRQQVLPIIEKLRSIVKTRGVPGSARRKLQDDQWVLLVPGELTLAVVVFSLEPAAAQIKSIEDIQRDFEHANRQALEQVVLDTEQMVFPHRALFENPQAHW